MEFSEGPLSRRRFTALFTKAISAGGLLLALPGQAIAATTLDLSSERIENRKEKQKAVLKTYNLPGDRFFPESIGYQASTGRFFVGSLENGQVVSGEVNSGVVSPFLAAGVNGMSSAAGIKVDQQGRLFVAGGYSGQIFIYDIATTKLLARFQVSATQTVINDFVTLSNGDTYVTDSLNPYLYKISSDKSGNFSLDQQWLALNGTAIQYQNGLNLNGIVATADNQYLIVGQTNVGKLFRIELATRKVDEIDLGGEAVLNADGILLDGRRLYVTRNAANLIAVVQLSRDYLRGKVVKTITSAAFQFPTALAKAGEQLLVVNAQLDQEGPGGTPVLPFNVVAITAPPPGAEFD
jgi:sugar lactone lactonase YvrE